VLAFISPIGRRLGICTRASTDPRSPAPKPLLFAHATTHKNQTPPRFQRRGLRFSRNHPHGRDPMQVQCAAAHARKSRRKYPARDLESSLSQGKSVVKNTPSREYSRLRLTAHISLTLALARHLRLQLCLLRDAALSQRFYESFPGLILNPRKDQQAKVKWRKAWVPVRFNKDSLCNEFRWVLR